MRNPILAAMQPQNNMMNLVSSLRTGNPDAMFNQMMNNNPQFRQFVEQNKGKSPAQIAQEHGIDLNQVQQLMR